MAKPKDIISRMKDMGMGIKPFIESIGSVEWDDIDWENDWRRVTFNDCLKVVSFSRGRSAANIVAKSIPENGEPRRVYTIFLVDFLDMLANGDVADMKIKGVFIVKKRGRNFGVRLKDTPTMKADCYNRADWDPVPEYI